MLTGLTLPFQFESALLQADLAKIHPEDWVPHYNESDYGGDWRGVALRSSTGSPRHLGTNPPGTPVFVNTPAFEICPYFQRTLAVFECPLKTVRLLSLASGSFIREHCDNALGYEDGEIRIHIPIQTGPHVEFFLEGERLLLEEGGCYYVNVSLRHRVINRGPSARIHLVIDAKVNDWLRTLVSRSTAEGRAIPRCPPWPHGFDAFRALVLQDVDLQRQLRTIEPNPEFVQTAVNLGRSRGFMFPASEVQDALDSNLREIRQRRLV
jgi:hypothetical protein